MIDIKETVMSKKVIINQEVYDNPIVQATQEKLQTLALYEELNNLYTADEEQAMLGEIYDENERLEYKEAFNDGLAQGFYLGVLACVLVGIILLTYSNYGG